MYFLRFQAEYEDGRDYLISANGLITLFDLLLWILSHSYRQILHLVFFEDLLRIISLTIRAIYKLPESSQENYLKYILYSGFFKRCRSFLNLASEFTDPKNISEIQISQIEGILDLVDELISFWHRVGRFSLGVQKEIIFTFFLESSEFCGVIQFLASVLLKNGVIWRQENQYNRDVIQLTSRIFKSLVKYGLDDCKSLQRCFGSSVILMDQIHHIFLHNFQYIQIQMGIDENWFDLASLQIILIGLLSQNNR